MGEIRKKKRERGKANHKAHFASAYLSKTSGNRRVSERRGQTFVKEYGRCKTEGDRGGTREELVAN